MVPLSLQDFQTIVTVVVQKTRPLADLKFSIEAGKRIVRAVHSAMAGRLGPDAVVAGIAAVIESIAVESPMSEVNVGSRHCHLQFSGSRERDAVRSFGW